MRSIRLLARQSQWPPTDRFKSASVELIIPFPGEGRVSDQKHHYYFQSLKKLANIHLLKQSHQHFTATIYCDGENQTARNFVNQFADSRFRYKATDGKESNWGHAQTRAGILESDAEFIVRMNCDNEPFPEYLEVLLSGFLSSVAATYARVIYKGRAVREHLPTFLEYPNELQSFLLPKDHRGTLEFRNIDCMNYMVRTETARQHAELWSRSFVSDWDFIRDVTDFGERAVFVDRIIGNKC